MYKRNTFGASCPSLRSRFGIIVTEMNNCENDNVMKEINQIRSKCLTVRFTEEERKKLNRLCNRAQCNSLSEYARDVLLEEPVTIKYRNQTADEFLEEMIHLKKELNAIGNNFNQAVHKLHTLDHISEIKTWAILNEASKKSFMKKVDEIINKMSQIYEQWSLK
jgi:FAD synthase